MTREVSQAEAGEEVESAPPTGSDEAGDDVSLKLMKGKRSGSEKTIPN
jgi:hypothetical protein